MGQTLEKFNYDKISNTNTTLNCWKPYRTNVEPTIILHKAIMGNNFRKFQHALALPDVNVNAQNAKGETALILCMRLKRSDAFLRDLLKAGSDITITDSSSKTALTWALNNSNLDAAHELIKHGSSIPEFTVIELREFVRQGNFNFIKFLGNQQLKKVFCLLPHPTSVNISEFVYYVKLCRSSLFRELLISISKSDFKKTQYRLLILYVGIKIMSVDMDVISRTHKTFGFDDEMAMLLYHVNIEDTVRDPAEVSYARGLITALRDDPDLKVDKLDQMGLFWQKSYCKLLSISPAESENTSLKLEVLNKVPRLYELTVYSLQRYLLQVHNVSTKNEFWQIVDDCKILADSIKRSLKFRPPLFCY